MNRQYMGPYVNFQGRAREAMEFYQKVLGGKLDLQAVNEQGQPKPAGPGDRIAYGRLEADTAVVVGSDGHPSYPPTVGDNMAIAIGGSDKDRLTRIFNGLAQGGKIKGPLSESRVRQGVDEGWLTDKFGINWVVSVEKA